MEFLYFLESIRNPFFDAFFAIVTRFGEETIFIVLGMIFFWCIDKKEGYYLLSIGFLGTVLNDFLKILFRVPRPWVRDPDFPIVEAARENATGYSFPSGHTRSAVGAFGAIATWNKNLAVRLLCIVICVLVALSRLYLGVHTVLDVVVSVLLALALVFGLYPLVRKCFQNKSAMRILFSVMVLSSLGLILYTSLYPFPADIDADNLESAVKNAYKMLGCSLGLLISYEVDCRFLHFETAAKLPAQLLKVVLGAIPLLLIKEVLRAPLDALFSDHFAADSVRYFLLVLFGGCIWPMTFRWFSRLFRK